MELAMGNAGDAGGEDPSDPVPLPPVPPVPLPIPRLACASAECSSSRMPDTEEMRVTSVDAVGSVSESPLAIYIDINIDRVIVR